MHTLVICIAVYLVIIIFGLGMLLELGENGDIDKDKGDIYIGNLIFFPLLLPFIWLPKFLWWLGGFFWFILKKNLQS